MLEPPFVSEEHFDNLQIVLRVYVRYELYLIGRSLVLDHLENFINGNAYIEVIIRNIEMIVL